MSCSFGKWVGAWTVARLGAGLLAAVPVAVPPLAAQEVVDMPAADRPLAGGFEEVYRIGSIDGETWETFGAVAGTAFDAAGNLHVFDRQGSRITVVDPSGRFVREVGEPGEGPGELRMPVEFAVMRDGRIVVADMGHRAYQLFGADGAFERMVAMGTDGGTIRMGQIAAHPSGDALVSGGGTTFIQMSRGPGAAAGAEPTTRPIDLVSLAGSTAGTRVLAEGWRPPPADPTTLEGGGMRFQMTSAGPRTFEPALLVGVLPDGGVVYSDSSAYALHVVGPEGSRARTLRRPLRPAPVTERMMTAERERRLAELEAGGGPQMRIMTSRGGGPAQPVPQEQIREMMRSQIEQLQFYPELPVIRDLTTSWTGKVWVERRGDTPTGPGPIDVLTPTGQYMGTFAADALGMPSSFGPDGLAAWITLDDFDVPTVVVRRLPPVLN